MDKVLRGSLLYRLWLALGVCWQGCWFHRTGSKLRAAWRDSATARLLGRCLGGPAGACASAAVTRLLARINALLWRLGQRVVPALRGSLLYRLYGAVFRWGRNSRIFGWLFRGGLTSFLLAAVGLYCLLDFALRDVLAVPVVSSVWDECLMLLAVLWLLYDRMRAPRPMAPRVNPLDTAVFLFMGVGLGLMLVVSPFFSIAVSGYRATVQYMVWFFLISRLLRDEKDLMLLYGFLVLTAFLISLHGIYQYIVAVPIPSNWTDQAEADVRTRVYSIFGSPNIMGDFMVLFAPMAAGLAYWCRSRKAQIAWWLVTFSMCFACLFTMSRGAWMAMAVVILIFALLVDRRLIALMLVALVCALFLPFVASRIGYLLTPEFAASTNNGGRGSRWDIALSYLAMNPVFGFGLGMFGGAVAMQHQIYKWISYFYVDNYYLKILVEMGWVGFACFVLLLLVLLYTGLRTVYRTSKTYRRKDRDGQRSLYPLCVGMFAGLCGVLVHCYFENIFEEPYMMAYFWTIASMLVYAGFLRPDARPARD